MHEKRISLSNDLEDGPRLLKRHFNLTNRFGAPGPERGSAWVILGYDPQESGSALEYRTFS